MRGVLALTLLLLPSACQTERSAPARSERERDSVIGASQLPGAQGVRGALRAQDSAAARNAQYDSVAEDR
jgi:hypothetical protein